MLQQLYISNIAVIEKASIDFESGGLNYAVLGIGINLNTEVFPDELKNIAACVSTDKTDLRSFVATEFLENFFGYYNNLSEREFLSEYRSRSLLTGREITFVRGNDIFDGTVTAIDDEMRLVVTLADGKEAVFSSGEVQLVKGDLVK